MHSERSEEGKAPWLQAADNDSSGVRRFKGDSDVPQASPLVPVDLPPAPPNPRDNRQTEMRTAPDSEPAPRGDTPAPLPRPDAAWCPELPEKDPKPPPAGWDPDPCAPLSSEGRSEGGKWVPETPLLTDPAHPDHELFKQALAELKQPELCGRFDSEAQRERVAAAIAADAKDAGLRRIDDVVIGRSGGTFIAIEGPNPYAPEARRVAVDYGEAVARSVEQSTAKITPEACTFKPGEDLLLSELALPAAPTQPGGMPIVR